MEFQEVTPKATLHCNRCDKAFTSEKPLTRAPFCGQQATRVNEFTVCPHCQQTDAHWVYAKDLMPEHTGNFEQRRKSERQWLNSN